MLDPTFIRQNPDKVKKGVEDRGLPAKLVDQWLSGDKQRRELIAKQEKLLAERNRLKKSLKGKPSAAQITRGKELRNKIKDIEKKLGPIRKKTDKLLKNIPNLPADDVPVGKGEEDNVEMRKEGDLPKFGFSPKTHLEVGEKLGIIDVKRAAKVSGSRFGYFIGDGAMLEMGLMWFVFEKLVKKGFTAVIPPVIVKTQMERALGYGEHNGWDQVYHFEKDEVVFVASSEHSVIPMHAGETLSEKELPKRYVNFSTCFRREAGTYGKDAKGMFRVHQFNKVEMNAYTLPDVGVSDKECLRLLSLQEEIVSDLKLPYRVMNASTGDLPLPNRRMYDIECWFPGQKRYRETHSCSNCTDYQTRRLAIKVKSKAGGRFVHALNATAVTDRVVLAILENYQQKDGSVIVPSALKKWVGRDKISF